MHPQLSRFAIKLVASLLQSLPSGDNPRNPQQKWLRQVKDYQEKMPRTQNDTGRAYEYAIVNYFEKHGYVLGTLAKHHSSLYEDYFFAQTSKTQRDFQKSAADFYEWFSVSFGSKVSKCIDGLPDNSGSVVDVFIGEPGNEVNFSLKHNHLALRHNRPHGLPERRMRSGKTWSIPYRNS